MSSSKDGDSDSKQFAVPHDPTTASIGTTGGVGSSLHVKQECGHNTLLNSKTSAQDQLTYTALVTTPQNSPGGGGAGQKSGLAKLNIPVERPKPDCVSVGLDTPLTHVRTGGGKMVGTVAGQRTPCASVHPLTAAVSRQDCPGAQSSGQQVSGQPTTANVRPKGSATRSSGRASSPSVDILPVASNSPSEKPTNSAEKPHGLSSEEARKLRQAQQKLQKEQWQKKYGHGSSTVTTTKRALEVQNSASDTAGEDGQEPQVKIAKRTEGVGQVGTDALISDGKLKVYVPTV